MGTYAVALNETRAQAASEAHAARARPPLLVKGDCLGGVDRFTEKLPSLNKRQSAELDPANSEARQLVEFLEAEARR
jgi:hypothetical protein